MFKTVLTFSDSLIINSISMSLIEKLKTALSTSIPSLEGLVFYIDEGQNELLLVRQINGDHCLHVKKGDGSKVDEEILNDIRTFAAGWSLCWWRK